MQGSSMDIRLPEDDEFDLPSAVCRYGFYLLAPNVWDKATATLRRPLHVPSGPVEVVVGQQGGVLRVVCDRRLRRGELFQVRRQVERMLRLNEHLGPWYELYPAARRARFGRLFRSPTVFEDIVKTMTCCNVAWANTVRMNAQLCELYGGGAFPTPEALAGEQPSRLRQRTSLGYRADWIITLAREVVEGRRSLEKLETRWPSAMYLLPQLETIHGIGPYAAANMLMLLGCYTDVAIDTETIRHCREHLGWPIPNGAAASPQWRRRIQEHYDQYVPFQFLAYWYELWMGSSLEADDTPSDTDTAAGA